MGSTTYTTSEGIVWRSCTTKSPRILKTGPARRSTPFTQIALWYRMPTGFWRNNSGFNWREMLTWSSPWVTSEITSMAGGISTSMGSRCFLLYDAATTFAVVNRAELPGRLLGSYRPLRHFQIWRCRQQPRPLPFRPHQQLLQHLSSREYLQSGNRWVKCRITWYENGLSKIKFNKS